MALARGTHLSALSSLFSLPCALRPLCALSLLRRCAAAPLYSVAPLCPFFVAADATSSPSCLSSRGILLFHRRNRPRSLPPLRSVPSSAFLTGQPRRVLCQAGHCHVLRQAGDLWWLGASEGHEARGRVDDAAARRSGKRSVEGKMVLARKRSSSARTEARRRVGRPPSALAAGEIFVRLEPGGRGSLTCGAHRKGGIGGAKESIEMV